MMGLVVCPEDGTYCSPLSFRHNKKFFMALWFVWLGWLLLNFAVF